MEIIESEIKEYDAIIRNPYNVYGSAAFNNLNSSKCKKIYYLLFRDSKYRLGLIGGHIENDFRSPFSAPFGGFSYISSDIRIQSIEEAIDLLTGWAADKGIATIILTLPPPIYGSNFYSKQLNCLWRKGFEISGIDLNYSGELADFESTYQERIWYNARKNLRISLNSGLTLRQCATTDDRKLAYEIVRKNRESHGYQLKMSWEQVTETTNLIKSDFFLLYNSDNIPIASAIIFNVNEDVVQVIYWGDIPGYSEIKPMNFLSFRIFEYYKSLNKKIVDIGPSSEHSVPNYGLCEFKEGIGCRIDPKYTLVKKLS